jgi:hypothetical protein
MRCANAVLAPRRKGKTFAQTKGYAYKAARHS